MSNKKYFWLKLKEDFFEEDTISWIEEQQNGKEYSLFYLKLCLKSLKSNGILIRNVGQMLVPYDAKMLSKLTNTEFDTVVVAMELFKKIGLVSVLENGEIFLPQLENMVGSESKWAQYKRKNNKLEKLQTESKETPKLLQTEKDKEIDIDLDKEKDKEIDIDLDKEIDKEIDYAHIKYMYNSICISYPKIKSLSKSISRTREIKNRISAGYTYQDFEELFKKAEASSFLKGNNNRNWNATFDWLIKEQNMIKVLEGNYDNKEKNPVNDQTTDNPFLRAVIEMGAE